MVDGQDYLLEFTDLEMRIYALDGSQASILVAGASQMIANGNCDVVGGWTASSPDITFASGQAQFHHIFPSAYIEQAVTLLADSNVVFSCDLLNFGGGSGMNATIGTTPGASDKYIYSTTSYDVAGTNRSISTNLTLAAGTYYVRITAGYYGGSSSPAVDNVSMLATPVAGSSSDIVTPWSANDLRDLHFTAETGMDRVIFSHPKHAPYYLQYNGGTSWDFHAIGFTAQPAEWGVDDNWPGICEIHKGRAYYSGLPTAKNRIWGSVIDDLFNMTLATGGGGTQLPGDCIDIKIATNGAVQWMKGNTSLLVGTDLGEHTLTGSKGVPLNGDLDVRHESAFGSCPISAVDAGPYALYVSADRKKVRALDFDLQTNKWASKDITFITGVIAPPGDVADPLRELHHAWTPDGMIIGLKESGKLAVCAFAPGEQVAGWWRMPLASGAVRSAAVSEGPSGAFLWMAVERAGSMWLERLPLSESTTDLTYLDASVTGVVDEGGAVAGLTHLNGLNARVIVNGAMAGDFAVADGAVQLDVTAAGAAVVVGLPYRAKGVTLPKNIRDGKAQSAKLGVILNASALPLLNGKRFADRTPATKMDGPEALRSGKVALGNLGWSDEDKITIEQDLPFRTEVLAFFSETEASR